MTHASPTPIKAGAFYWAIIFALGFVLGTVRNVWGAEAVGETAFVLVEIPLILLASWFVACWLVRRHHITRGSSALVMGAIAFALLMVAELALTLAMAGGNAADGMRTWIASVIAQPGIYGFAGQIIFALMPLVATRVR